MTVNEGTGSNTKTQAYHPDLVYGLTHMRIHGLTPIHETDAVVEVPGRPAWWAQAACRDVPASKANWFPTAAKDRLADRALDICARCPVSAECLSGAVERREDFGIWAGVRMDDGGRSVHLKRDRRESKNEWQRRKRAETKGAA